MAQLEWGSSGNKEFRLGIHNVALFIADPSASNGYATGVAWDGVTAVNESPSGAEENKLYANDAVYAAFRSAEQFGFTIEAYTSPDEFNVCDGIGKIGKGVYTKQQNRRPFGLVYMNTLANDTLGTDYSEELHIVYNATASPADRNHETVNESPDVPTTSWECVTTPINIPGFKPSSHIVINRWRVCNRLTQNGWVPNPDGQARWDALIRVVYGTNDEDSYLPLPETIIELFYIPTPYESAVPYITRVDHSTAVIPPVEDPLDPITISGDTVTGSLINRYKPGSGAKSGFILYELDGVTITYPDNNLLSSYYLLELFVYYPGLKWVVSNNSGHYETLDGRRIKLMFRYNGTTDSWINGSYQTHETVEMFLGYGDASIMHNGELSPSNPWPFEVGGFYAVGGQCPADATQLQIVTMYADNDEIIRTDDLVLDLTYRPYGYLD